MAFGKRKRRSSRTSRGGGGSHGGTRVLYKRMDISKIPVQQRYGKVHKPEQRIRIANSTIQTGHNFQNAPKGAKLWVNICDDNASNNYRNWPERRFDVGELLRVGNTYGDSWDNDYYLLYIVNAQTGEIRMTDHGRQIAYVQSEILYIPEVPENATT